MAVVFGRDGRSRWREYSWSEAALSLWQRVCVHDRVEHRLGHDFRPEKRGKVWKVVGGRLRGSRTGSLVLCCLVSRVLPTTPPFRWPGTLVACKL